MSPVEISVGVITLFLASALTIGTGLLAWIGQRLHSKVDLMDKAVRGDGNGNPGLAAKIRDVHSDVKNVQTGFQAHVKTEPERIQAVVLAMKDELCEDDEVVA